MESIFCPQAQSNRQGRNRVVSKVNYWIMWMLFVLLSTIIFGYTYFSQIDGIYVNKPIVFHYWDSYNTITHQTTKLEYFPGEIVYAKIIAYKPHIWPATIQWSLIDGCFCAYPARDGVLEAGRNERITRIEQIPLDAKTGVDYFSGTSTFDLNFIRRKIHIPIRTNTFIVNSTVSKKN